MSFIRVLGSVVIVVIQWALISGGLAHPQSMHRVAVAAPIVNEESEGSLPVIVIRAERDTPRSEFPSHL